MGRLQHSRPWPVLRDGASRLLRTRMRSHTNARRFAAPGAIPTLDFLLHRFGAAVKKTAVKSLDWMRRRIRFVGWAKARNAPCPRDPNRSTFGKQAACDLNGGHASLCP